MRKLLTMVAAAAMSMGGFAGADTLKPIAGSSASATVRIDATRPGATLPNSSQVLTFWNGVRNADGSPVNWKSDVATQRQYPIRAFVRYAELMACTGGNKSRDLFGNPNDRTKLDDYDFGPLVAACRGILVCGIRPYLKLGNVPAKFSADYDGGEFSMNIRPPTDDLVHYRYMRACAAALKQAFGRDEVRQWRFAVLTEADNTGWFQAKSKSKAELREAFFRLYDYAAKAFEEELGPGLVFGTHLLYPGDPNCPQSQFSVEEFVAHCTTGTNAATGKIGSPMRLLTASYYAVPDRDDLSQGRCVNLRRIRAALDAAGMKGVVTGVDEGRVIIGPSGRERRDIVTRAVGASYEAAFDVRVIKEIFDDGMDYFATWGYFSGPRATFEGVPSHHYFSSRELAKFEGLRRIPAEVSGAMPAHEELDAISGVSADGRCVRVAIGRFRDRLVFTNRFATTVSVQLPQSWANRKVRVRVLTLDDRNNWYCDWERDRTRLGVAAKDFKWSPADFAVLSPLNLQGEKNRRHFAEKLQPGYAAKAASVVPVERTVDLGKDAVLSLPVDFVGNGAAFVEVVDAGTGSGFGWPEVRTNELTTAWGRKLTPANAWREYPRPQMVREGLWQSLNGTWDLTIEPSGRKAKILVPFPVESQLSGVRARVQPTDELVYRRTFVARRRAGFRTLLNFEAVDFRAQVFVNGIEALDAPHEGGCVPFSVDVTDLLAADGENKLEVRVWDPTDTFINSTGKQTLQLRTCFFPPSSGIIGSVWTEEAPETYLEGYRVTADPDTGRVVVTPSVKGDLRNARVKVEVLDKPGVSGRAIVSGEQTRSDRPVVLQLPKPWRLWSCDVPNLYGLRITVAADGREDGVEGYFGVRRLTLARDRKGLAKLALNGRPVYLLGVLDQGYWPDGYLTPPSEDACRWDVDFLKDVGVNCIRKHIKVEPRCFYAHCDRVGILVMQDMPSAWRDDVAWSDAFEHGRARANTRYGFARRELKEIVDHLGNHPSVVCWIPYNEGWSQPDEAKTFAVGRWLRRYDPTRLIDLTSGWSHFEDGFVVPWLPPEKSRVRPTAEFVTDIIDCHEYPGPRISAANPHRAVICGEFGAMAGGAVDGHYTDIRGRAARFVPDTPAGLAVVRERNRRAYRAQTDRLLKQIREGSSGGILCEDVDCFWEGGGYVSFDRAIERFDRAWLREIHREMYAAYAAAWEK